MLASVLHSEVAIIVNFVHIYFDRNRKLSAVKMATAWLIFKMWRNSPMSNEKKFTENISFLTVTVF